ncbi:MAG: S24/S26 family peptidase [Clostridia bacterium]|nr:S24/S26 family peptidase [Clostridia bacterium]
MLQGKIENVEKILKEKGEIAVCTSGTSMYPMLRNRKDMSLIKSVEQELEKNDVVLYRVKDGKLVLHRILNVENDCYVIRGDNLYKKEYIKKDDVFGVLKGFYRNGKYVDCGESKGYRLYILYVKLSFSIRYLMFGLARPFLGKVKRFLKRKIANK